MLAGSAAGPTHPKYVAVTLLTQETISLQVETKALVSDVQQRVYHGYLQNVGMLEDVELFGLAVELEAEIILADEDRKVSKYASRAWKVSHTGTDSTGTPLLKFFFCVRYYLQTPLLIRDSISLHHYYLQLRQNLLKYDHIGGEETAYQLASYALQADLGDVCDTRGGPYFDPSQYCPQWVIEKVGRSEIIAKVSQQHHLHTGLTPDRAKIAFVGLASSVDAPLNVHVYNLRKKKGEPLSSVTLTVGDRGVTIYEDESGSRKLVSSFPWLTTELVTFDKKKFTICSANSSLKHVLYASSDEMSRHLWLLCRLHHQHSSSVRPRVADIAHRHKIEKRLSLGHTRFSLLEKKDINKSLESINHLIDERLDSRTTPRSAIGSGSLDSLQNYLSGSASSSSSDNLYGIKKHSDLGNEGRLSMDGSSPTCSRVGLDRVSSIHSSSSQLSSASTVRSSKYPSPLIPELTLGADLADLSLTPELPDLADISTANDCDAVDGNEEINRNHNCCSTCYEDQENDSDDEQNSVKTLDSCHCGSCSRCENKHSINDEENTPYSSSYNVTEINRSHHCTESNFNQLDNNDDYVDFYKDSLQFQSDIDDQGLGIDGDEDESLHRTLINANDLTTENVLSLEGIEETAEEQHLDYSVESAQDIMGSNYSHRGYVNYDGCLPPSLGSENDSGRYSMLHPASVTMATIKTALPPVNVVSSTRGAELIDRSDSIISNSSLHFDNLPHVAGSDVNMANSSEAPAKLITSRHKITVLKAITQETYSPTSFHAIPLTRGRGHTLPQIPQRPKGDGIQSLQRTVNSYPNSRQYACCPSIPEGNVTVDGNNYLDIRASSHINKNKLRMHPRQPITNVPRSLYLRHQKKELQQQQRKEQRERLLMDRDIVYQPAAFASDVGVPLQPTPSIVGYQQCAHNPTFQRDNSLHHQSPIQLINNQYICQPMFKNFYQDSSSSTVQPCDGTSCPMGSNCNYQQDLNSPCCNPEQPNKVVQQRPSKSINLSPIEQYNAQLNSDVDYVIYPMKDPAISKQEYMDAKQSQVIANQTQQQLHQCLQYHKQQYTCTNRLLMGSYKSPKLNPLYRSTPNVAGQNVLSHMPSSGVLSSYPSYQSLASHNSMHQPGSSSGYSSMARGRYYSQQSLTSSLSSTPSGYSTHSLSGSYDPYGELVVPVQQSNSNVMRVRSDESILSSTLDDTEGMSVTSAPPHHRPPPPYRVKQKNSECDSGCVTLKQLRDRSNGELHVTPMLAALCSEPALFSSLQPTDEKTSAATRPAPATADKKRKCYLQHKTCAVAFNEGAAQRATYFPGGTSNHKFSGQCPSSFQISKGRAQQMKGRPLTGGLVIKKSALKAIGEGQDSKLLYSTSDVLTTNQIKAPALTKKSKNKPAATTHLHPGNVA